MNTPAYIVTSESITIVVGGKPYTASVSNANFPQIKERIVNEDFDGIEELFDTGAAVGQFTNGNIVVQNNAVLYKGENVDNHVVDRILDFMRQGLPYKPLCNFLDKLMQNPSRRAVQELYRFLEHKKMPLTPDGNFLAYKSVRSDWTDHHTGKFSNTVGSVLEMTRQAVCDDANIGCSYGFHAGSLDYAKSFGGGDSRLLIVEINPADVVSIPHDCNCQKLRTAKYKVVGTFERPLEEALNTQYSPCEDDGVEYECEDESLSVEDSFEEGYSFGWADAEHGFDQDADTTLEEVQDGRFNDDAFIEGYNSGYEEYQGEHLTQPSCEKNSCSCKTPVAKSKPSVSETTRAKLRAAALRQRRDDNGKFI
jgi:hypothetical protein